MRPVEIKKGIYWVGVVDWDIRTFHGNIFNVQFYLRGCWKINSASRFKIINSKDLIISCNKCFCYVRTNKSESSSNKYFLGHKNPLSSYRDSLVFWYQLSKDIRAHSPLFPRPPLRKDVPSSSVFKNGRLLSIADWTRFLIGSA